MRDDDDEAGHAFRPGPRDDDSRNSVLMMALL